MSYFQTPITVRFSHTDPAGIVFFPRYFEMFNEVMERWFDEALGMPFATLMQDDHMTPTVHVDTRFLKASRLGEKLEFLLGVTALSRSRIDLEMRIRHGGEDRVINRHTIVWASKTRVKATPIPDEIRARMENFLIPAEDAAS